MFKSTVTFWPKAALLLSAAGWGVATVISKATLAHLPPITLLVIQLTASVVFLWTLLLLQRKPLTWNSGWLRASLLGWLNPGLAYTFSLLGLSHTTASMSTLLWATEPILILGLAWLMLRERLTPKFIALSLFAMAGVWFVSNLGMKVDVTDSGWGNGLILAGVACCAIYTIVARNIGATMEALMLVALQQTCALLWAIVIWPIELTQIAGEAVPAIPLSAWGWAITSGIMYYGFAFWFYLIGLQRTSASQAGIFLNLIPVFGVSTAYLRLGERLTPSQLFGAALILSATLGLVALPSNRTHALA